MLSALAETLTLMLRDMDLRAEVLAGLENARHAAPAVRVQWLRTGMLSMLHLLAAALAVMLPCFIIILKESATMP